jgi:hypothetical protein
MRIVGLFWWRLFSSTSHINGAPLYITASVLLCIACTKHLALQIFQDTASSVSFWLGWSLLGAFISHLPFFTGAFCYCNAFFYFSVCSLVCAFFPLLRRCQWHAQRASKQSAAFLDLWSNWNGMMNEASVYPDVLMLRQKEWGFAKKEACGEVRERRARVGGRLGAYPDR